MNINLILDDFKSINVFDLSISQEEGSFAHALVWIEAGHSLPRPGMSAVIESQEVNFKGYLAGGPHKMKGNFQELELIACPSDFITQLEEIQRKSRVSPYWDPLWVKDVHNINEIQDVHTSSLYCDRRTGELSRSDWFEGRQRLILKTNFFKDSLEIRKGNPPLRSCKVSVHAHWIQKEEGIENLGPSLQRAFPSNYVSTYTKEAFQKKWPEAGKRLGRSGLWVLKSGIDEIFPPGLPRYSPLIRLAEEEDGGKGYRATRFWFKPTLWVGWQYHQRRKETLCFTLSQVFKIFPPQEGEEKEVEFTLQNINPEPKAFTWCAHLFYREGAKVCYQNGLYRCKVAHTSLEVFEAEKWSFQNYFYTPLGNPARASFFSTERGLQAAEHAIERAKALLAKSARAFFVSFEAPWSVLRAVTTDTSIELEDPRLPGGKVKGKVISYALYAKGETQEFYGKVTLACSVGGGKKGQEEVRPEPQSPYCEVPYESEDAPLRVSPSGIAFFQSEKTPPPQRERGGSLLREVKVVHGPEDQEELLLALTSLSPRRVEKAFAKTSTRLQLFFKDLRTREVMEHVIPITIASVWSAPEHMGD